MMPGFAFTYGGGVLVPRKLPIGQFVEPSFKKCLSVILIVEIVGVLPKVADDHWSHVGVRECVVGIMCCANT